MTGSINFVLVCTNWNKTASMSQRVASSSSDGAAAQSESTQGPLVQQYPEMNPLMPSSLRMIPPWYEGADFRHSTRLLVGMVPGAILLITVTGTTMLTAILGGALLTILIRYLGHNWLCMVSMVGHVVFLEVVNVYCMAPLIWRSVLNLPLYAIFHLFIALTGILWWLQEEEFRKQEPRFVIMLERMLFYLYPAISITMVTWICGILFGRSVLPFVLLVSGVGAFSLYFVPLQSSFTKPNTPAAVGLIQHRFVVWLYTALVMVIPALTYVAISHQPSLQSFLLLALLLTSPPFLLTLLEAQGLGHWFGLSARIVQLLRMLTGVVVLVLVTACVSLVQPPSLLPLLLLPILLLTMALISVADHASSTTPTLVVGGLLALVYTGAFAELPWSITRTSSFLSLPLSVLQLLLWVVALVGVAVMTLWSRVTPQMLVLYNGVFVFCEYVLTWDKVYPLSISMATGVVAVLTFWSHTPSLGSGQLLSYSGLILVGLLLSVDTILSPIWASLTHSLPSSPNLLATVLGVVALYVNYGLSLLESRDTPPLVSSLPPSLGVVATLLWLLQPEFSVPELVGSLLVTVSGSSAYPEMLYVAAWKNLLTWLTLFSTIFALLQLTSTRLSALTTASTSLLGVLAGFLSAISFLQVPPGTIGSLLYAAVLGVGGALCGRAYSTHNQGGIIDKILFSILFGLYLTTYSIEWLTLPHYHIPGRSLLDEYAKPCTLVIAVCSLVLACVFRVKMYWRREEPYLPVMANIACTVFFLTAILQQFHPQLEIVILLSSLVFLLTQPDGFLRPERGYIFVAPCLVWSVLCLYCISISSVLPFLKQQPSTVFMAGRLAEFLLLILAVPGHLLFMYSLWCGERLPISLRSMMAYVLPHCLLPQLASSMATSILGSVGIFCFCLTIISDYHVKDRVVM